LLEEELTTREGTGVSGGVEYSDSRRLVSLVSVDVLLVKEVETIIPFSETLAGDGIDFVKSSSGIPCNWGGEDVFKGRVRELK
jgi:hypothetical protein